MSAAPPRFVWVNGLLVESDALRIAERVHEYDSNLSVKFLNEQARDPGEPPYMVVERCKDGVERPVFSVWILDETVLQRIFAADNQKWNVLNVVDSTNATAKSRDHQRYRESLAEASEITKAVLKSPKSTYTVPESVTKGDKGDPNRLVKFRDHGKLEPDS